MEQVQPIPLPLLAPRGFHAGTVDATGRLKLPAPFTKYLAKMENMDLFMTEYRGKARIFTNGSWRKLVALLDDAPDHQDVFTSAAESIGGDIELDPQGRITIPQKLRAQLKLESQPVQLRFHEDVITFWKLAEFEQMETANTTAKNEVEEELLRRGTKLR